MEKYEWKQIVPADNSQNPGPRRRHSGLIFENQLILFGGQVSTTINTNSVHIFDFTKAKWVHQNTTNTPPPIDSHLAFLYDPNQGQELLQSYSNTQNSPNNNALGQAKQMAASLASNQGKIQMIVFGGYFGGEMACYSNAVYSLNLQTF